MSAQRKTVPEFVQWDQQSILREIAKLKSQISILTTLTENPSSDTRAVVVREVRAEEIINALAALPEVLERIQIQLGILNGINLEPGETL